MKVRDIRVVSSMITNIEAKSDIKKSEIATKLKNKYYYFIN